MHATAKVTDNKHNKAEQTELSITTTLLTDEIQTVEPST